MENKGNSSQSNRASIIETVQTPLGFFTLTILVVEVILGIAANFSQGSDRSYLIVSMIAIIFLLVAIVAGFAFFRPEALRGRRPVANRSVSTNTRVQPNKGRKLDGTHAERIHSAPSCLCAGIWACVSNLPDPDRRTAQTKNRWWTERRFGQHRTKTVIRTGVSKDVPGANCAG